MLELFWLVIVLKPSPASPAFEKRNRLRAPGLGSSGDNLDKSRGLGRG